MRSPCSIYSDVSMAGRLVRGLAAAERSSTGRPRLASAQPRCCAAITDSAFYAMPHDYLWATIATIWGPQAAPSLIDRSRHTIGVAAHILAAFRLHVEGGLARRRLQRKIRLLRCTAVVHVHCQPAPHSTQPADLRVNGLIMDSAPRSLTAASALASTHQRNHIRRTISKRLGSYFRTNGQPSYARSGSQ